MSDSKNRNGDSPQFELAFPAGNDGEGNGDSPRIRVSKRARRLSIRVYPDARVEVVVPPRARPREVEQFIAAHREWIESRRALALRNRPVPQAFPPAAIELRISAERWRLHLAGGSGRTRVVGSEGILRATGASSGAGLRTALRAWLLRAAETRLAPRVAALAAATGVHYSRVSIRRQRSRWGSCSARGTISLNCCLLFQRPEVVDYLIVHELMHVKHMNHSARFWQAVERHCADWRALDRELVQGWRHVPRWVFSEE
ncbi:MAG TPA: SprT family zinc-dependent metalloprotease [Steroidobacteraceae bacterium]|jgi:predicted metal-dependent hydrolase|nr:SprT family zinc-dependent metalloprotease [Steroidobacteraceae bacterium]